MSTYQNQKPFRILNSRRQTSSLATFCWGTCTRDRSIPDLLRLHVNRAMLYPAEVPNLVFLMLPETGNSPHLLADGTKYKTPGFSCPSSSLARQFCAPSISKGEEAEKAALKPRHPWWCILIGSMNKLRNRTSSSLQVQQISQLQESLHKVLERSVSFRYQWMVMVNSLLLNSESRWTAK